MSNYNHKLHPKHMYRDLSPFVTPRLRGEDMEGLLEEVNFTKGKETRSIWCEDKKTKETLFVCPPPKTMREAIMMGYMMGKAAGYKSRDYFGDDLRTDLFGEDVAHYVLYGYYPDEEPPAPEPISETDFLTAMDKEELPELDIPELRPKAKAE